MKNVNVNKEAVLEKLKKLKSTRLSSSSNKLTAHCFNLSEMLSAPMTLIHYINKCGADDSIRQFAIRNYYINLVSVWETFLRDLFVLILYIDKPLKEQLANQYLKTSHSEIPDEEALSLIANFQNLEDIDKVFKKILNGEKFLDIVGSYKSNVFIDPYVFEGLVLDKNFPRWKETVEEVFSLRHSFIHNANFEKEFDLKKPLRVEWVFMIVPNIFSIIIANHYNLDRFSADPYDGGMKIFYGKGKFNFFWGINDLVSIYEGQITKWMVEVDEEH